MEYDTSRKWTAACQLGPRVWIVGECHVSIMRWRVAERAFGPAGNAARFHRHWPNNGIWAIEGAVAKMYHSTGGVLGVLRVLRACCGPKFLLLI